MQSLQLAVNFTPASLILMTIDHQSEHELAFLENGGEMGKIIRLFNWNSTPLGAPEQWSLAIKNMVSVMLASPFPAMICWGATYIQVHNDAFKLINQDIDHLGEPFQKSYPQDWKKAEAIFSNVMSGKPEGVANLNLALSNFELEATFSPIRNHLGIIEGVFVLFNETSKQKTSSLDSLNIIKQAPFGICAINAASLRIDDANPLFLALLGSRLAMAENTPYLQLSPALAQHGPIINRVIETLDSYQLREVEHVEDGKKVYIDFIYQMLQGIVFVFAIDVTERVNIRKEHEKTAFELSGLNEELAAANEEYAAINEELAVTNEELVEAQDNLMRSEKLFKSIALNIPKSLILVIDKDRRFITIEGDIMEKLGYNSLDYTGKHLSEVIPAERYEATKHFYDRLLEGEKFSTERTSVDGDNFMVHFVPLKDNENHVEAGLIIALEITEFKQAEERSAKLAAIIESSEDAIISKTLESVITSWNHSAVRMFGYTEDEIIGESIYKLIPPDRTDEEPRILSRLKNGERVEHFETKRLTKSGKLIDVSLTISPVKDKEGKIIGLSKIIRDITYKKQEEQRKNDFVAMVSHELKTPLTTIHSYVQLLLAKSQKDADEFHIKALTRTEVQTKKMSAMINDFLSIARLEEGEISIHKEIFEFTSLATDIINDVQFLTSKHEIKLLGCNEIRINGDRDKLGQVLNNLLTNAIKYAPNGGAIIISCEKHDDKVKIAVKDAGIGIKLEDQKRLFERFYRVDDDKLRTVSGFGIGLHLVSEILRHHQSKIEVESKENEGSTFYFSLAVEP
ncbi:MAG: PAS domain S-box protein [Pedobacter sp.]|nr:MAG: PAS domain S-box protein [Pedobacter sp.]